jgi:hypothetical protein
MIRAPLSQILETSESSEKHKALVVSEESKSDVNEENNVRCHESIMPSWAKSDPTQPSKKSPFDIAEEPIPGK